MRMKSVGKMSADELAALVKAIKEEEERRAKATIANPDIQKLVKTVHDGCAKIGIQPIDVLNVVVAEMLGNDHAIYLRRGAKAGGGRKKKSK